MWQQQRAYFLVRCRRGGRLPSRWKATSAQLCRGGMRGWVVFVLKSVVDNVETACHGKISCEQ